MAFQVITFQNGNLLNILQTSSMLTLCIHVKQVIAHKNIWIPSTLNNVLMSMHALFKQNDVDTCIQHLHKKIELTCTPSCCNCQNNSISLYHWQHFICPNTMAVQVRTSWDEIFLNVFQASSTLPHFAYMLTKLLPTKASYSQPFWMSCLWTILLSLNVPKLAQPLVYAFNYLVQHLNPIKPMQKTWK